MTLNHYQKIHCVGIGGIGVSAIAQFLLAQGKEISGSDVAETEITQFLRAQGIKVFIGHAEANLHDSELIIYSDAVPADNPERIAAHKRGIAELSYAQALGQISRNFKTIVVTGTHGKSTTTVMLGLILETAGFDPLVMVGTRVPQWGNSNLRLPAILRHREENRDVSNFAQQNLETSHFPFQIPDSRFFIVEGDDYRDHFLELSPYAVVVTNIEYDHPDYFRNLDHTVESFKNLVEKVPEDGFIVVNEDDRGCQQLFDQMVHSPSRTTRRVMPYGRKNEIFGILNLQVPGEFNRYNAAAAATCALELGVPRDIVERTLAEFRGVWRRFEIVGQFQDLRFKIQDSPTIISDYGHHPSAIKATMKAVRKLYYGRRLVLVYQPHQHSRTKRLFSEFVEALKDVADFVIVSEIYAVKGRMEDHDVSSRNIVEKIGRANVIYGGGLKQTDKLVRNMMQPGDVVIFMGAGDIDLLVRDLVIARL